MTANSPVTLDVRFQRPNARAIDSYPVFVGPDYVPGRAIAPVNVQTVAVALQLILFSPKALFVGPQVRVRAGLRRRISTQHKRHSQNEGKPFTLHSLDSEL
jgi:hypothetical protein